MAMDITLITGMCGMALILLAFVLNVFKQVDSHAQSYLWMNAIGGAFLVLYAILLPALPFLVLNAVWTTAALWGLLHHHGR
jgi:hypothetical protein